VLRRILPLALAMDGTLACEAAAPATQDASSPTAVNEKAIGLYQQAATDWQVARDAPRQSGQ
jgi:hypothetical protein